jgi:hypothetical protein
MNTNELTTELSVLSRKYGYNVCADIEERFRIADGKLTVVRLDVSVDADGTPIISDEFESPDEMMRAIYDKVKALPRKIFDKQVYEIIAARIVDGDRREKRIDGMVFEITPMRGAYDVIVIDADGCSIENHDFDPDAMDNAIEEFRRREEESEYETARTYDILRRQFLPAI